MNFNTYLLGAMTVVMEWPFETCMSQCTSAQHFLHPCVASYRILLQKWLMCYFSCLVMQLLWAPGHCSKALGPAQNRDTGSLVLRGPGEPLVALFVAFTVVTKLSPAPFSGASGPRECSAIQRYLLGSSLPQIISTHSLHPWKKMGWSSPLLPQPASPDLCYNFIHNCDFFMGFFSFWWHFSHGNRKISECFVKISVVCLFLSLTCMKEIVHCLISLCKWEIALTSKHSEVLLILLSLVLILFYILFGDLGQAIY